MRILAVFSVLSFACAQPASDGAADHDHDHGGGHEHEHQAAKHEEKAEKPPEIPRTASLAGARVFFKAPADGAKVKSPVKLEFGIEGMTVTKAGDDTKGTGHHHLIIDADLPPFDAPIPANENYIHFGDGSTSKELELSPGEHKLRLILGDHLHIPHEPPVYSDVITITVEG